MRSSRNWGVGDFSDLAQCARTAGRAGAALVGLNPLHARHLAQPDAASPYWPSSRLFLDVVYIDVEAIEEFAQCPEAIEAVATEEFRDALQRARDAVLVDYPGVTALKLRILRLLHRTFSETSAHAASPNATFALFQKRHGAALVRFAEFEALRLTRLLRDGWVASWRDWPDEWRDPDSAAMARFRIESANEIEFQMYLQWQAERQLDRAAAVAREAGLRLALYRDLAVGAADDSAESWGDQRLVASGASIGAPPDLFARDGQNWGLPPMNPRVLAERAYKPLADLLAANMRGAGALRIDHVMALQRLFWIPSGMPGTRGCYVNNPFDALTAIVALESVRQRSMVIGEDLGSVPDGLRERLHDLGLLSYRVLIFERHWHGDGSFKRPWHYPAQSLATVATHDMPTIADFWQGSDIERRARLGLYQEPALHAQAVERREAERRGILSLLAELGLTPPDSSSAAQVAEALHAVIARTPAMLAVVQLDDVVGEIEPVNIPGTTSEYPNWRRKTSLPIEELGEHDGLRRIGSMMKEAGRI